MQTYRMKLVLGDWSHDGHNISEEILLESNLPVSEVRQAYKDSCKLTGLQFNINENYTGVKRTSEEQDKYCIATEYGDGELKPFHIETLLKFGLDIDKLELDVYEGVVGLSENYANLWIWFVQLSNPALKLKIIDDEAPYINGYWNEELNVGFGYGLFSS